MTLILLVLIFALVVLFCAAVGAMWGWMGNLSDAVHQLPVRIESRLGLLEDDIRDLMDVLTEEDEDAP